MVKGVARHAVVVRSPELKDVEQAIFIMSGTGGEPQVTSHSEMLSLARQLAGCGGSPLYVQKAAARGAGALTCALWYLAGCITAAAVMWALSVLPLI